MSDLSRQTVLVVDDHEAVRKQLYWALEENYRVLEAASRAEAIAHLEREDVSVVLCDLHLPPLVTEITEGVAVLEAARRRNPPIPVIVITGSEDRAVGLEVVQRGAYDLFQKPFSVAEVEIIVRRAAQHYKLESENAKLRGELERASGWQEVVGSNPRLQQIFAQAREVAATSATVLITGESGTGKEVLARAIHRASARAAGPFIPCSIAALPENLVESELFGHERGAFTGAATRRQGRFELADGGTLFLDEIGELTPSMQVKLLRVLQERQFERLGGKEPISVDIRVIAATNRNLEEMAEQGAFRADLYYRLNVVNLELPPLRERADDIPLLAAHFARKAAAKHSRQTPGFTPAMLEALTAYRWPGNIRELENVIERSVVISNSPMLDVGVLPERVLAQLDAVPPRAVVPAQQVTSPPTTTPPQVSSGKGFVDAPLPDNFSFESAITEFKRQLVRRALRECKGSRSEAANLLKISRQYLHRLINELQVTDV